MGQLGVGDLRAVAARGSQCNLKGELTREKERHGKPDDLPVATRAAAHSSSIGRGVATFPRAPQVSPPARCVM